LFHELGVLHRGGVDRYLVGTRVEQPPDIFHRTHAAADRKRHEAALGRAFHDVEDRIAVLVARRDVEKAKLIRARGVIGGGGLHRVTRIDEIDEVDALDDAAVLHVETGNDACFQHVWWLVSAGSREARALGWDRGGRRKVRGR